MCSAEVVVVNTEVNSDLLWSFTEKHYCMTRMYKFEIIK